MPTTPEDRIRAQFRAAKTRINRRSSVDEDFSAPDAVSDLYLSMARQWKMSVQDLKAILGTPTRETIAAGKHSPPWDGGVNWDW